LAGIQAEIRKDNTDVTQNTPFSARRRAGDEADDGFTETAVVGVFTNNYYYEKCSTEITLSMNSTRFF
jgi:hypothetical protein